VGESESAEEKNSLIEHFYDDPQQRLTEDVAYEWREANPKAYKLKAYVRHLRGQIYNRVPKVDTQGELPIIMRSLPRFFEWLQSEQVALTIHTELKEKCVKATSKNGRLVILKEQGVVASAGPTLAVSELHANLTGLERAKD
jgi:hypothetical protein